MTEIVLFIEWASGHEWPVAGEGYMCLNVPRPYQTGPDAPNLREHLTIQDYYGGIGL